MSFGAQKPDYCKIARRIAGMYAIEFAQPRGLQLTAYGGAMMYDIEKLELRFLSLRTLNVDEARMLYVEMMEEFLHRINQNNNIRPYLHDYPFGIKNIKLVIAFDDYNGHILGDGHVAHMFIGRNDTLYYDLTTLKQKIFILYIRKITLKHSKKCKMLRRTHLVM